MAKASDYRNKTKDVIADNVQAGFNNRFILPPNLLQDSGRFVSGAPSGVDSASTLSSGTLFANPYNGSVFSSAGFHFRNNSSGGGPGAALPSSVLDLFTAMGKTAGEGVGGGIRYTTSFNILQVVTGAGTSDPINGIDGSPAYISHTSSLIYPKIFTVARWFRVTQGAAWILCSYVNGSPVDGKEGLTSRYVKFTPSMGFQHVVQFENAFGNSRTQEDRDKILEIVGLPAEWDSFHPNFPYVNYAELTGLSAEELHLYLRNNLGYNASAGREYVHGSGNILQHALPYLCQGHIRVDPSYHTAAIPRAYL